VWTPQTSDACWPRARAADVVDAHVAVCARRANQQVVTSDPEDLRMLDPTISLVTV